MVSFARSSIHPLRTCRTHHRCLKLSPRTFHSLPTFNHLEEGFGKFLPPPALNTLVHDWHKGLLDRLNEQTRDTPYARKTVMQTVKDSAPIRADTLIFNHASLAVNNHFFLDHLKPPPTDGRLNHEIEMDPSLENCIKNDFGSLEQFKSTFGGYALGMSTSGYIWLCTNAGGTQLVILPTFGPGTLILRTHSYAIHQNVAWGGLSDDSSRATNILIPKNAGQDASTSENGVSPQLPSSGVSTNSSASSFIPPGARSYSTDAFGNERNAYQPPNRQNPQNKSAGLYTADGPLFPLFSCSLYEHAWMSAGFGVWGKEDWLKELWTVLDWEKVNANWAHAKAQGSRGSN